MPPKLLQEQVFQQIRDLLPPSETLVDAVADVLHLSNDSAYRRIRGETPLLLEEAAKLCARFQLSLDRLMAVSGPATLFEVVQLQESAYGFETYLAGILKSLQQVAACREKEIIYLTKDLGLFHLFHFRPLFAFRYFFWMKSILHHPDFRNSKFSIDCLPAHIEKLGREILQTYNSIPSTEIWNAECINSSIAQVEYYREAGFFARPDEVAKVYQALQQTIEHLKEQADKGCKFLPGESTALKKQNFQLFHNRVVLGDNTILTLHDGRKTIYLNYDVLNYMVTHDAAFCNDVHQKLQNLMRRATLLSHVSEKQRNIFFHMLQKKIPKQEQDLFQ
jgi:hypothetical protein